MLEMLSWYGGCTIAASYEALTYRLTHVICEDIGLALGAACQAALRDRTAEGVEGSGFAYGSIDEALAFSHVSFEGRSGSYLTRAARRRTSMSRTCSRPISARSSRGSPRAAA